MFSFFFDNIILSFFCNKGKKKKKKRKLKMPKDTCNFTKYSTILNIIFLSLLFSYILAIGSMVIIKISFFKTKEETIPEDDSDNEIIIVKNKKKNDKLLLFLIPFIFLVFII